jgi:hypothetical protein
MGAEHMEAEKTDAPMVPDYRGANVRDDRRRTPLIIRVVAGIACVLFGVMFSLFFLSGLLGPERYLLPAAIVAGSGAVYMLCIMLGLLGKS